MNKLICILVILSPILSNTSSAQGVTAKSWHETQLSGEGELKIIYYSQYGLIQKNKSTNKLEGLCVRIIDDFVAFIKKKYDVNLTVNYIKEETSFSEFLNLVKASKHVLGVGNITITEERKKTMDFTPYYITNPLVLVTNRSTIEELSTKDKIKDVLTGYKAVVIEGSTHEKLISKVKAELLPNLETTKLKSGTEVIKFISQNQKYFSILDLTELVYGIRNNVPIKQHRLVINEDKEKLGFATSKNSDWTVIWAEFMTDNYRNSIAYKKHISECLGNSFLKSVY